MDLLSTMQKICQQNGIKPAHSRGQNFLIRESTYDQIVEAADLQAGDVVLEVGPGLGFLTEKLSQKAKKVIAVELDDKLAVLLKKNIQDKKISNIEVVNKNILDVRIEELGLKQNEYKIVANLPYNITSIFLRRFLSEDMCPDLMVLMLQKEVAERISAKPGDMSLLAVSVQYYADAEIIMKVPRADFWPSPAVDSAVIKIKAKNKQDIYKKVPLEKEKDFFRLVKFGFSSKRKMLKNNLAGGYHITQVEATDLIKKAGFDEKARAQELSLKDWQKLFDVFSGNVI